MHKLLLKSEGNSVLSRKPHFIFSAENPYYDQKLNMSHDDVISFLKKKGYNVEEMDGHYGNSELSIIVHEPPEESIPYLHKLAQDLGQESGIHSDGTNHEMHFYGGENAGKFVRGSGTNFHKIQPKDYYSLMNDGTLFTHNMDMDNWFVNREFQKSEEDERYLEHYSPKEGLKTISPFQMGTGVDRRQRASQNRESKFSFYYPKDYDQPEPMVTRQAKSKYTVKVPKESKIFDAQVHGSDIINQVKQANQGAFNIDHFVDALKQAGYHGFKSRPQGIEMVAMFNELPVHEESPIQPFQFKKSEIIEKGAMKRVAPFNPTSDIYDDEADIIGLWQQNDGQEYREEMPEMDPHAKMRALNKLSAKTKVRKNPKTGKREFLLHRGMGQDEYRASRPNKKVISNPERTSWTPYPKEAKEFAGKYSGPHVSAWIGEDNIFHIPSAYGTMDAENPDHNQYLGEFEVVVNPHESEITSFQETGDETAPTNIDEAINARGKLDGTWLARPQADKFYRARLRNKFKKAEEFTPKISKTNHSDIIRNIASSYAKAKGIEGYKHPTRKAQVNKDRAAKIAAAYHEMKHDPDHPDVKSAYDALINETMDQWNHIKQSGLKVSKIKPGMENPYKSSKDLLKDVRENNHMWYFPTDQGFGSSGEEVKHPLLKPVNEKHDGEPMVANDLFRIVHDYFGHAKEGYQFGPVGEENAWHEHRKMYSPLAQKALTSETRGQNSWVNFGPHGEQNRKDPANTIYADQKAGLLPDWAYEHDEEDFNKSEDDLMKAPVVSNEYEDINWPYHPLEEGRYARTLTHKDSGTKVHVAHGFERDDDADHQTHSYYYITDNGKKDGNPIAKLQVQHMDNETGEDYSPRINTVLVNPEHRRKGLGTILHLGATKDYGELKSDYRLSPGSQKIYEKLANNPKVDVNLEETKNIQMKDGVNIFPQETQHTIKWKKTEDLDKMFVPVDDSFMKSKRGIKRGDHVHLSSGTIDHSEPGRLKIDRTKKYVVHGHSKRGEKAHWVVPHGEKDTRKGFYHRADRTHHVDDVAAHDAKKIKKFEPTGKGPKTKKSNSRPFYIVHDEDHPTEAFFINFTNKDGTSDIHHISHHNSGVARVKDIALKSSKQLSGNKIQDYEFVDYVLNPSLIRGAYEMADPTGETDLSTDDWWYGKSEGKIEKSVGPLQLKGLKDITTRPDQQVQSIGSPKQGEIARRTLLEQQRRANPKDVGLADKIIKPVTENMVTSAGLYSGKKRAIDQAEKDLGIQNSLTPRQRKTRDEDMGMTGTSFQGANIGLPQSKEPSRPVVPKQHFNQPIGQHEAHHHLFAEVGRKYGPEAKEKLIDNLYEQIDPKLREKFMHVLKRKGYRDKFKEETINQVHDLITHHPSRRDFFTALDIDQEKVKRQLMGSAKKSWKNLRNTAKQVTPEFFKSENLEKGAMKRIAPFNPVYDADEEDLYDTGMWQEEQGSDTMRARDYRESLPRMSGNVRKRMLNKLMGMTKYKKNPDGSLSFLMHRGMSGKERRGSVLNDQVSQQETTSWTPDYNTARSFAVGYRDKNDPAETNLDNVVSAWIHEGNIEHMPRMLGRVPRPDEAVDFTLKDRIPKGPNKYQHESEVIVSNHKSPIAVFDQEEKRTGQFKPRNIDERIGANEKIATGWPISTRKRKAKEYRQNRGFNKSELEKNMKGIRAGLLSAALGVSSPSLADTPQAPKPNQVINHDQRAPENNKNHVLNAISMVESSGGKNTEHERLPADSIHQGERAYGSYGLTPLLIRETIGKHKDLARKYGHLKDLKGDQFHQQMGEHPELEKIIASRHYDRLARKFGHDPAKIGFAWLNGISGAMKAIKNNADINNHWHVQKIMDAYKKSKSGQ